MKENETGSAWLHTSPLSLSLSVCCSSNGYVLSLSLSFSKTLLSSCFKSSHHPLFTLLPFFYVHYQNIHSLPSNFPRHLPLISSHFCSCLFLGSSHTMLPKVCGRLIPKHADTTAVYSSWKAGHENLLPFS